MQTHSIAIVYDWLDKWGGVERVLLSLHDIFPQAVFYTSYLDVERASWAKHLPVKTSFINRLPSPIKKSRVLSLLLYPYAFESFNFNTYDVVISVTSSFAKGIITQPHTFHLCYLLTPSRFLWVSPQWYGPQNPVAQAVRGSLKEWDRVASARPDKIISISQTVRGRCKEYYGRDSELLYPPFDLSYWANIKEKVLHMKNPPDALRSYILGNYYLLVARLEPYKRADVAIQALNARVKDRLLVVGDGSERTRLKRMAGPNVTFIRHLTDEELAYAYVHAEAMVMPQEEDFGYTCEEALFFGCPVITYFKGGQKEMIEEGKTGLYFTEQTKESLDGALERFHIISYNVKTETVLRGGTFARKNSKELFKRKLINIIAESL